MSQSFNTEVRDVQNVRLVVLAGELDSRSSDELSRVLNAELEDDRRELLLDLAGLDYISSAGLRVLVMVTRRLSAEGGHMIVCAPNRDVEQVFEIAGMKRLFDIRKSRADALRELKERHRVAAICDLIRGLLEGESDRASATGASPAMRDDRRVALAAELLSGGEASA